MRNLTAAQADGRARRKTDHTPLMTNQPLCSVIITAYNAASDLPACLDGLLAQDYPCAEVILVDNASTDETASICALLRPDPGGDTAG